MMWLVLGIMNAVAVVLGETRDHSLVPLLGGVVMIRGVAFSGKDSFDRHSLRQ